MSCENSNCRMLENPKTVCPNFIEECLCKIEAIVEESKEKAMNKIEQARMQIAKKIINNYKNIK